MIRAFTDRRPVLSAVLIALLFSVVPGIFLLTSDIISGGSFNAVTVVVIYAFVLELIMMECIDRPILIMMPFIMSLIGFIICEIIYTLSLGLNTPGGGPSGIVFLISSVLVTVFGADGISVVAAFICHFIIKIFKAIRDMIIYR